MGGVDRRHCDEVGGRASRERKKERMDCDGSCDGLPPVRRYYSLELGRVKGRGQEWRMGTSPDVGGEEGVIARYEFCRVQKRERFCVYFRGKGLSLVPTFFSFGPSEIIKIFTFRLFNGFLTCDSNPCHSIFLRWRVSFYTSPALHKDRRAYPLWT